MDIATYSKEIAPLVSNILTAVGLVGLFLTAYQILSTRRWNKVHLAFTFLPHPLELEELEAELDQAISFWRKDTPLEEQTVKALTGDLDANGYKAICRNGETDDECKERHLSIGRKLKLYINLIELYCTAINSGVVSEQAALHLYRYKFNRHNDKVRKYIDHLRLTKGNNTILCEFDRVLKRWSNPSYIPTLY